MKVFFKNLLSNSITGWKTLLKVENPVWAMATLAEGKHRFDVASEKAAFLPSDVQPVFMDSAFQNGEREACAAFIVVLLSSKGDNWDDEFSWVELRDSMTTPDEERIHPIYIGMIRMPGQGVINAMHSLVADGFLEMRDSEIKDETYFKVTEKFIGFYSSYVKH